MLIKNPDDVKLAPLGKLSNMQIRAAITEISFLGHNSKINERLWLGGLLVERRTSVSQILGRCRVKTLSKFLTPMCNVVLYII